MTKELINNTIVGQRKTRSGNVIFKVLITFFILIINTETISYLLFQNDELVGAYQKFLVSIVLLFSIIYFFKWSKGDRVCFLFFVLLLMKLVGESLIQYHSILIYPSVLAVIFPFLYVYFIKNSFRMLNIDIFNILIVSILLAYFIFMLIFGKDFDFSNAPVLNEETGPFSGDTRILHANSILLIELPFLYFLSKMFSARRNYFAITGFSVSLIIILIHQHRTVWLTTIFSSALLLFMRGTDKRMLRKLFFFILFITGIFTLLIFTIPSLGQLLAERIMDVFDPLNEDNTGGFRYLQILAYLNYFIQKPLFGWTFSGFELPNPFLDNWEERSGHHFHDAYIEVLFYFGITGLLLKFFPLYSVVKKIKRQLSDKSKVLVAFSVSGFVYAFSYVPPLIFWGVVGLCLYYIDRDIKQQQFKVKFENDDTV